jgi:squalene-associated FAD-dependent desaturase
MAAHASVADVAVIGAGFAGLSAAVRLADAGFRVIVLEEAPRLGGRASAFTDRETGERLDNGQHVLFGCYRETYAFLRQIGADHHAPLQPRLTLPVASADGRLFHLTCPRLTPPWHLLVGVLRWRALGVRDRLSALRIGRLVRDARRLGAPAVAARVPVDQTVDEWLMTERQTVRLCQWLWHPLAIAALNQAPDTAAASPFVRVVAELFGPRPEDAAVGVARVPLDELYAEPARRHIEARGGIVLTRSPATVHLDAAGAISHVSTGEAQVRVTAVVSAVPWHAFSRIWPAEPPEPLREVAARAAAMKGSPIVTVNLWLEGAAMPAPFVGLVGGPMHWAFDKSAIFGERAGHLSVVASGADDLAALGNAQLTALAVDQLQRAIAGLRGRRLQRAVVVRERRATFSLAPGSPARPPTLTALAGFYLAGDWTDTGLPATIEGAVASGHRAADEVMRGFAAKASRGTQHD